MPFFLSLKDFSASPDKTKKVRTTKSPVKELLYGVTSKHLGIPVLSGTKSCGTDKSKIGSHRNIVSRLHGKKRCPRSSSASTTMDVLIVIVIVLLRTDIVVVVVVIVIAFKVFEGPTST